MTPHAHDRCRDLLEQLSRYIDGDLTGAERRAFAAHLDKCPCCQTMADHFQQTVDACRRVKGTRLPPDVRSRARERIKTLLASGPVPRRT
jgi:anti-sigma factor (TIGR02949 family)